MDPSNPPPYPGAPARAPYPQQMGAQPYPTYLSGPYGAYQGYPPYGYQGYPPHSGPVPPGYAYGPRHTMYIVEERRRGDPLTACLQACLAALCCCCLCDMMTACD